MDHPLLRGDEGSIRFPKSERVTEDKYRFKQDKFQLISRKNFPEVQPMFKLTNE